MNQFFEHVMESSLGSDLDEMSALDAAAATAAATAGLTAQEFPQHTPGGTEKSPPLGWVHERRCSLPDSIGIAPPKRNQVAAAEIEGENATNSSMAERMHEVSTCESGERGDLENPSPVCFSGADANRMLVSEGVIMEHATVSGAEFLVVRGEFHGDADVTHLEVEPG